jgi:hypothetical protein
MAGKSGLGGEGFERLLGRQTLAADGVGGFLNGLKFGSDIQTNG